MYNSYMFFAKNKGKDKANKGGVKHLHPKAPLYDRLGGEYTVNAAIESFYAKIQNEERLTKFFVGISLDKQITKQKAFMKMAMGGTDVYKEKNMREAHKPLVDMGLNDSHIDIFLGHFRDTLKEHGIADNLIDEAVALADSYRDDILNR